MATDAVAPHTLASLSIDKSLSEYRLVRFVLIPEK